MNNNRCLSSFFPSRLIIWMKIFAHCGGKSEYFMNAAENQISLEDLIEYLIWHFSKLSKLKSLSCDKKTVEWKIFVGFRSNFFCNHPNSWSKRDKKVSRRNVAQVIWEKDQTSTKVYSWNQRRINSSWRRLAGALNHGKRLKIYFPSNNLFHHKFTCIFCMNYSSRFMVVLELTKNPHKMSCQRFFLLPTAHRSPFSSCFTFTTKRKT